MKLSKYLIWEDEGDKTIVASTITKSIVRIGSDFFCKLKYPVSMSPEELYQCKKMRILVPDDLDERKYISFSLNQERLHPEILTTYVAFTSDCNFDCPYCFQQGQPKKTMTPEIVDQLFDWHSGLIQNNSYKKSVFKLFGGEPLLNREILEYFLQNLRNNAMSNYYNYELSLVSNGYLLDKKIFKMLQQNYLTKVQITLDGSADIHDLRRPLKNGGKTYKKILRNLKEILRINKSVKISVRVSIDLRNYLEARKVIDDLSNLDEKKSLIIYPALIYPISEQKGKSNCYCSKNITNENKAAEILLEFYRILMQKGFEIPDFYDLGPCMTVADNHCLVAPDGKLYKCVNMMGSKLCIGSVFDEDYKGIYYDFMEARQMNECLQTDCVYVPICGAGCLYQPYLKTGNIFGKECHFDFLDKVNRGLLKLKYKK